MRLLKASPSGGLELVSVPDDNPPPYAILSHTWVEDQEVTHAELATGTRQDKTGYDKIHFCIDRAADDGVDYCWVDTCCIDKSNAQELQTAINSMFRYYQHATKCYVYLSDVYVPEEVVDAQASRTRWETAFRQSRWFTRGWTLQELLAPPIVEFFSRNGKMLGTKLSLEREICNITKLPLDVLRRQQPFSAFSFDEKLRWSAQRTTTIKEDKVYCLLGIFEVLIPVMYGEGEAYAAERLKDEIARRQQGRGTENVQDLIVSPPLPFPRNEQFVAREDELRSLQEFLVSNTHRRKTVYGLGGCGKSALVLEFAYRALAQNARRLVFWVPAISRESFELAYREIGIRLCVSGITDDNADVPQLVKDALNNIQDWLMIVDNADEPEVLMNSPDSNPGLPRLLDYIPHNNGGKVVFTTRSRKAAGDLTQTNVLELQDLGKVEARDLLTRCITKPTLVTDGRAIDELLEMLTYLPLAIVQAAAFINNNDISLAVYMSLLRNAGTEIKIFGERFEDPSRYREMDSTIAKTWYISFDQIRKQDKLAAEYLSFIACIDRINIPQSLLPPEDSPLQHIKAVGTLKGYAFITEGQQSLPGQEGEAFFNMHRLVHMMSAQWLDGYNERKAWIAKAAERLQEVIPYGGHEKKDWWTVYLPHAVQLSRSDSTLDEETRASLLDRIGRCQSTLGKYSAAEATYRQALVLREGARGLEDQLTLIRMDDLATALSDQGNYAEAESMHRQTLATSEKVLSVNYLDTLITMNNLAVVLERQGKYAEAELIHRQTLATRKKVLGVNYPDTLRTMNNLAVVLDHQGKYMEAESMYRQTLATRKKLLGVDHPDTLRTMNNLAGVLGYQGKYAEAESMHRQGLALCEKVLGFNHPDTLSTMSNLAVVLGHQGRYAEAESMHRQELTLCEKVLGADHPDTLMSEFCLAYNLVHQYRYDEAELLYKRACAAYQRVLGNHHPDTRACLENYSEMLVSREEHHSKEVRCRNCSTPQRKRRAPSKQSAGTPTRRRSRYK